MNKGYTLVEVMVSAAVFSLIIGSLTGFFLSTTAIQKKSLSSQQMLDSVSYTLEYISRAVRMAKKDDIGGINCLAGDKVNFEVTRSGQGIKFRNYLDECQEFYVENGAMKEARGETVSSLTPSSVEITLFRIGAITSWDQNDYEQAKVVLFLDVKGVNPRPELEPKIQIQTTISQRNLDVQYQ
jgi:prepilin-type N-terminal cleavage/methylation domain-containing protein